MSIEYHPDFGPNGDGLDYIRSQIEERAPDNKPSLSVLSAINPNNYETGRSLVVRAVAILPVLLATIEGANRYLPKDTTTEGALAYAGFVPLFALWGVSGIDQYVSQVQRRNQYAKEQEAAIGHMMRIEYGVE